MTGPFKDAGASLIANGYQIVPIPLGDKRPALKNWPELLIDVAEHERLAKRHTKDGVGILTKYTPAVDVDIYDVSMVDAMRTKIERRLGHAPMRVGRAPKCLFIFKTDEPFDKITSNSYIDPDNATTAEGKPLKQRIEILGNGQQFVAYHTHPDTGKPYDWPGFEHEPLDVPHDELLTLTVDDAIWICEQYEALAERMEWRKAGSGSASTASDADVEVLAEDKPPAEEDDEISRVKSALAMISADCDRDTYLRILAALKWTTWESGEEIAREWAESAPEAFVEKHFNNDWRTLKADRGGRKTATIATIYGMAKDLGWDSSRPAEIDVEKIKNDSQTFTEKARALAEGDSAATAELLAEIRAADVDDLTLAVIFKEITKTTKISIGEVRKAYKATREASGMSTHATYANKLIENFEEETGISPIAVEGKIFTFNSSEMVWQGRTPEVMSASVIKHFDGKENCERLTDYIAIARVMHNKLVRGNENFFLEAPIGMACEKRFYAIGEDGHIEKSAVKAEHRQRVLFPVSPKVGEMPLFTRFLDETFAGNQGTMQRDLVQEILGATLLGFFYKYEKAVLFYGPGRSGKGTMQKIFEALIPRSARSSVNPVKWSNEYYLARLAGVRLNTVGEIEEEGAIDGAVLKSVSGRDTLTGRVPAGMPFEFTNLSTHLFNSNYFPPTRDQSDAFFSRWVLVWFTNSMLTHEEDIDQDLAEKIIETELPAISAWAIKGAKRLIERKKFALPPEHFMLMDKWRKRSNSVVEFITDKDDCRLGSSINHRARRSDFYAAYAQWCRDSGRKALGKQKVYELMATTVFEKMGVGMKLSGGIDYITGIMLAQSAFFLEGDDDEI